VGGRERSLSIGTIPYRASRKPQREREGLRPQIQRGRRVVQGEDLGGRGLGVGEVLHENLERGSRQTNYCWEEGGGLSFFKQRLRSLHIGMGRTCKKRERAVMERARGPREKGKLLRSRAAVIKSENVTERGVG